MELNEVPFSVLPPAKLRYGLSTSLTGFGGSTAAEGIGDIFLATDTGELYICLTGTAWTLFAGGGGGGSGEFSGIRWRLDAPATIPDSAATYVTWDAANYTYGDYGTVGALILIPVDGIYRFIARLLLENSTAANWIIQVWSSDFDILQTHNIATDGSGGSYDFIVSGEFKPEVIQPDTGGWFLIDLEQDSGGDLSVGVGSYVTLSYAGALP